MSRDILLILISSIAGGGLFTALSALLKVRPERGKIIVDSAGAVVIMYKNFVDELQEENHELQKKIDTLEEECAELRRRCRKLEMRMLEIDGKPSGDLK